MSGGPVFDLGGRIVAVHGIANYDQETAETLTNNTGIDANIVKDLTRNGFNYAIPINTFLQRRDDAGVSVALNLENTAAPEPGQPIEKNVEEDTAFAIDVGGIFEQWLGDVLRGTLRRIPLPF
jgi:hypothetical protein